MRNVILAAFIIMAGFSMTTASFAATPKKTAAAPKQEAASVIKGIITSINAAAKQITIEQDGSKTAVIITAIDVSALKEGQHVKVILKAGTADQAESIKVIAHKKKK
ncbi:MAG: hypothetical protein WCI27_03750 [Candidatus Omnitrophota bacterium]